MTKVYSTEKTAMAVASKLNKKLEGHEVMQLEDGWHVVPPVGSEQPEQATEQQATEEVVAEETAPAPVAETKQDVITVEVPSVKETAMYLISEPFMGKPRWFEKARLVSYEFNPSTKTATITLPVAQVRSRDGMKQLLKAG